MEINVTMDHLLDLKHESLRVYLWMVITLPAHGYELSYRDIAGDLFMSPATVKRAVDLMVEEGYVERTIQDGLTATYKILR